MGGILGLIILAADIFAIVDCIKGSFSGGKKALWIILILVLPILGVILYFLIGKKSS